jgi:DNA-binding PadR family transcriptional regulator
MDNPLRKEITSHIEASGELACWIAPYLYHAAYQTVKDMERDGVIVVEVGKRGEPVYVFAPTPPPADAPTASDTTGLLTPAFIKMLNAISEAEANNRPVTKDEVSADEQPIIDGLRNVGYIRAEREDNFVTYFITDRGREKWSSLRKPAAPTPAAAAAQAAPSEKPKAAKLTAKQRDALEKAASKNGVWNNNKDNRWFRQSASMAPLVVLRALEKMGYVQPINAGHTPWTVQFVATEAGRAALDGAK